MLCVYFYCFYIYGLKHFLKQLLNYYYTHIGGVLPSGGHSGCRLSSERQVHINH